MGLYLPDATGLEPSLYGSYLKEIQELSRYILPTASTNCPHNLDFQTMWICFYTTRAIANKLAKYFESLDPKYDYLKNDNKTKEALRAKKYLRGTGEICSGSKNECKPKDYFGNFGIVRSTTSERSSDRFK
jgi:hypothetical protein